MILPFLLSFFLSIVLYLINKSECMDFGQSTTFECGFSPMFTSRYSHSIHFMMTVLVFLIMDLEICILMPYFFHNLCSVSNSIIMVLSISIILMTLYLEINYSSFDWSK